MKKLFSIYDVKAGYFAPPFLASNEQDASRQIAMAIMASPTIPPAMYPEDFFLVQLGDFDEVSGVVKSEILRHYSCDWILKTFTKKSSTPAEESKKEDVEK